MIPTYRLTRYLSLLLGLIAYTFAGLNWNVGIAAWIAPVLLLYYSKNSKWAGLLILYLGLAFCSSISKTAENLSGVFLIYITTGLTYGLIYILPYVFDKILVKKGVRFYSTLVFPSAIVATEYLLSLGIGIWGNGAVAQFHNSNLIQLTSVFGVFGISFLVSWLASVLNWIAEHGVKTKRLLTGPAIYGILVVTAILFGFIRQKSTAEIKDTVKVAAVVGETDIQNVFEDWKEEIIGLSQNNKQEIPSNVYSDFLEVETMIERTDKALSSGAKIAVWNEISLLLSPAQKDSLLVRIKELCIRYQAYVLIAILEKNTLDLPRPFNNISILVNPDGEISWEYLKYFLNPLESLVINKGNRLIHFTDTDYGRVSNVLCSDLDFSAYISQIGKKSVDILLVPAFDWKEVTLYHAHMAAFAAVQYGVNIVRANGKGISAFYDTRGRILKQSNSFTSDVKITFAELPVSGVSTLYSKTGDLFVYVWLFFLLVIAGLRLSDKVKI